MGLLCARWDDLTAEEKRIAIARRKRLGRLSCDLLYERLPLTVAPLKGVTFRDWLAASALHGALPELDLSDRELLVSLINTFVNSQTTVNAQRRRVLFVALRERIRS